MILLLALILCFMAGCKDKTAYVERFVEDGVEVVMNLPVPQDELENPVLNKILSIDTENDELVEYGMNDIWNFVISLIDSNFAEVAELGRISIENIIKASRESQLKYPFPVLAWGLSNRHIFVGSEQRGYDIHVYDLEGTLTRKIRKQYTPVPFSEESRRKAVKRWVDTGNPGEIIVTPKSHPPFQHLFADDTGRLYVATFEPGYNEGEFMIDVFDIEGVLFARLSLMLLLNGEIILQDTPTDSWVTVKNDILYCIQEKESGHKQLVAYETKWK